MAQSNTNKDERLARLAHKLARIIHEDIQKNGDLKPSYMSPKFWAHVQSAMRQLEAAQTDDDD